MVCGGAQVKLIFPPENLTYVLLKIDIVSYLLVRALFLW